MTKRRLPMVEHADTLSLKALRELVTGLVERADRADARIEKLEAENQRLCDENDKLRLENTRLKIDNQLLRDEIARLKNLPPRPPFRPSGMEKATGDKPLSAKDPAPRPRGPKNDTKRVTREEVLPVSVPPDRALRATRTASSEIWYSRPRWFVTGGSAG